MGACASSQVVGPQVEASSPKRLSPFAMTVSSVKDSSSSEQSLSGKLLLDSTKSVSSQQQIKPVSPPQQTRTMPSSRNGGLAAYRSQSSAPSASTSSMPADQVQLRRQGSLGSHRRQLSDGSDRSAEPKVAPSSTVSTTVEPDRPNPSSLAPQQSVALEMTAKQTPAALAETTYPPIPASVQQPVQQDTAHLSPTNNSPAGRRQKFGKPPLGTAPPHRGQRKRRTASQDMRMQPKPLRRSLPLVVVREMQERAEENEKEPPLITRHTRNSSDSVKESRSLLDYIQQQQKDFLEYKSAETTPILTIATEDGVPMLPRNQSKLSLAPASPLGPATPLSPLSHISDTPSPGTVLDFMRTGFAPRGSSLWKTAEQRSRANSGIVPISPTNTNPSSVCTNTSGRVSLPTSPAIGQERRN